MNKCTRLFSLLMAAVMAMTLAACSQKPESSAPEEDEPQSSASEYPFYNPLTEPEGITNDTPIEPDTNIVDKIKEYQEKNAEAVAWFRIPDTTIDDVVFQDPTGNKKYERLDNDGKFNLSGCYFADYRNTVKNRASLGKNTIIYGHNLNDDDEQGERFARLLKYDNIEYATEHPYLYLTTPEDEMVFKVFAVFYLSDWRNFDYIRTNFTSNAQFNQLVNEAKSRSLFNFDVSVTGSDKILTLSTCTYKYGGFNNRAQRFVVMGRLLHATEKDTDPVTAVANPSPKDVYS